MMKYIDTEFTAGTASGAVAMSGNVQTGETTWERPADMAWKAVPDEQGHAYYENEQTSEVQWEKPVVIAWEKAQFNPHVNILS